MCFLPLGLSMQFNINAKNLPRFLTLILVIILIVFMTIVGAYLLTKNHSDNQSRLAELRINIKQQNQMRLKNELKSSLEYIYFMQEQTETLLKERTKETVNQALAEVNAIYNQTHYRMLEHEIKDLILETLKNGRFPKENDSLFVSHINGMNVLNHNAPEFDGNKTNSQRFIGREILQSTEDDKKSGYYRYNSFVSDGFADKKIKITYARLFEPFNWVIGSGSDFHEIEDELKRATLKRLEHIRFGRNGYIAVFSEDGTMLSENTDLADMRKYYNTEYKEAVKNILEAASSDEVASYKWAYPGTQDLESKESYVVRVPDWDWLLVSGYYPRDIEAALDAQRNKLNDIFIEDTLALVIPLGIAFILALFASVLSSKWLSSLFERYQYNIDLQQTALEQTAEEMRKLAEFDPLTNLPNRRLLHQEAEKVIQSSKSSQESSLALLFIDLDRFKTINDSLGHAAGDKVLQEIGKRLICETRSSDMVCRIGGDEFVILMRIQSFPKLVSELACRISQAISQPLFIDGHKLVLTPSIGIASFPQDGKDFATLQRNGDTALYHAKDQGRNNFQFYTPSMSHLVSEKMEMEKALRNAIAANEFELHYQPQYHLNDNSLYGCEALIRWNSPTHGYQSPVKFIPVAELTGLILPIGNWVLRTACQQGALWLSKGYPPHKMSVNLSPAQFKDNLFDKVKEVLQESGFPSSLLTLEITESVLMEDAEKAIKLLSQLKQLGISIAIDDFGTGFSSLAYLKRFPLDELKIDKAFIDGLPGDQDDFAITSSIIDIASNLKLHTVAEGVETRAQCDILIKLGCDNVQGYYYAKPMPAIELESILNGSKPIGVKVA